MGNPPFILNFLWLALFGGAMWRSGYLKAKARHHQVMARGFYLLGMIMRQGRTPDTEDILTVFGPTSWDDAKGWKPPWWPIASPSSH